MGDLIAGTSSAGMYAGSQGEAGMEFSATPDVS